MRNLNKELEEISELKKEEEARNGSARSIKKEAGRKMEKIRQCIREGETTGDRIRDFVIVARGAPNPETENIYRELEAKIAKHDGEFILLVGRSYEFHGCTGFGHTPQPHEYVLETNICLGILNGKEIIFNFEDHPNCEIPTSKYARPWGGVREEMKVEKENIKDSTIGVLGLYWSILELGKPAKIVTQFGRSIDPPVDSMEAFNGWRPEQNPKLEIKIGDVEVDAWFKANKRYEKTYGKMQKALERIAQETPEIKERQEQIIKEISELTKRYRNLWAETEKIANAMVFKEDKHGIVEFLFTTRNISGRFPEIVPELNSTRNLIIEKIAQAEELGLNIESIKDRPV